MSRLSLKLTAVLVLLVGLPLGVAFWQSGTLFERSLGAGLNPVVAAALEDAVGVYGSYVASEKARQRAIAHGIGDARGLLTAAQRGPLALQVWLRPYANAAHVRAIELRPINPGGPTLHLDGRDAATAEHWMLDEEVVPLQGVPGWASLHYSYGLDRAIIDRFERMESEVITPFATLAADRENIADIYAWSFMGNLAIAVLLAALVAVIVGRRLTRRLRALRKGMDQVAGGQLDVQVNPVGHDEVADLARDFNQMAQHLRESHARVQYLTQVSAWQGIARRLAHEIKNPLTPILLSVQQVHMSYKGDDARFRRVLDTAREIVEQEVTTLKRLVEHFSRFAKLPAVSATSEDLRIVVDDVVTANGHIAGIEGALPTEPVAATIDRGLLRQALSNLVKNADEANRETERPPIVRLTVEIVEGGAVLHIDDTGPGVPPEERMRVFEPYVTGKHDGTGLGLAIVKKIVLDHGGEIAVDEAPTGGARFTLHLPT
jgi:nitrogen fixation/metabolism regulation signal transduction histidine kinase